jgi:peptidyl-prolyl cis-trans isomerase NIMA-interacting 1
VVKFSSSKQTPYFHNSVTGASTWDAPPGFSAEQISQLPGYAEYVGGEGSRPAKVRASHLLVKHKDSRRPASWKEVCDHEFKGGRPQVDISVSKDPITRTKEEAIEILHGYRAQIGDSSAEFARLAETHSDCSSHSKGGDLGWFGPGQMQKAFEDGTYALQVGQISDIVDSDSGVHLILRTG